MENKKKDSPAVQQEDSKEKVLELQELDEVAGGTAAWSVGSNGCADVGADWSTHSAGC